MPRRSASSSGETIVSSAIKSPNAVPSSAFTGASIDIGSFAAFRSSRTFSSAIFRASASSRSDGSRPLRSTNALRVFSSLFIESTMCTGRRTVRP